MPLFGFFDILGSSEFLILAVIAVLLYGERLPEVARKFGKQFVDFKKSLQGIRQEFEAVASDAAATVTRSVQQEEEAADRVEATAPKFDPPPPEEPQESHP
ncbi:MAG: twin-arginine translocase TatA/TatE family subunit [Thermoguttaceae bacterium]|jgi:sec-independent protein translocase protein TatA